MHLVEYQPQIDRLQWSVIPTDCIITYVRTMRPFSTEYIYEIIIYSQIASFETLDKLRNYKIDFCEILGSVFNLV